MELVERLGDPDVLSNEGVVLSLDDGRGRLVGHLREIPQGSEWSSADGLGVERFGNVVRVGDSFLDIPFEARAVVLPNVNDERDVQWPELPAELISRHILVLLDERDLLRLASVSRWFRRLCLDAVLWMELFASRFGFLPPFLASSTDASGFWMSRFAYQCAEVRSFGRVTLSRDASSTEEATRVVLMGPVNAGKTTLLNTLQSRANIPLLERIKSTLLVRTVVTSGFVGGARSLCTMKYWDIPGEARNRTIASVYCQKAHCLVFVYDCNDAASFEAVKTWVWELRKSVKSSTREMVLLCNKYERETHCILDAQRFAAQEKLRLVTMNIERNQAFEWRLFNWKLAAKTQNVIL